MGDDILFEDETGPGVYPDHQFKNLALYLNLHNDTLLEHH